MGRHDCASEDALHRSQLPTHQALSCADRRRTLQPAHRAKRVERYRCERLIQSLRRFSADTPFTNQANRFDLKLATEFPSLHRNFRLVEHPISVPTKPAAGGDAEGFQSRFRMTTPRLPDPHQRRLKQASGPTANRVGVTRGAAFR